MGNQCKIDGCKYSKNTIRRGYCSSHYRMLKDDLGLSRYSRKDALKARPAIIEGNIAKIPLGIGSKGGYAIIDKEDSWVADKHKFSLDASGYALSSTGHRLRLHAILLGKPPKGFVTDHINRNRLDNRRCNLRFVTFAQNIQNSKNQSSNFSGYMGVSKSGSGWRAYIKPYGKQIHIGVYKTKDEAALAYDKEAYTYWGEHAYLNLPERTKEWKDV